MRKEWEKGKWYSKYIAKALGKQSSLLDSQDEAWPNGFCHYFYLHSYRSFHMFVKIKTILVPQLESNRLNSKSCLLFRLCL